MKLKDLMTAQQALEILDYINSLESRIKDLEMEVQNLKNEQAILAWRDVNLQTEIYNIYKEEK